MKQFILPFFNSKTHITRKAIMALLLASFIWGGSIPVLKWTLFTTPVLTLAFFRFFVASFLLFILFRPNLVIQKKHVGLLVLTAVTGVSIYIPVFLYGLKLTSSVNAGIITSAAPILVMICAAIFLKEHITKSLVIASVLGTIGVSIIVAEPLAREGISSNFLGNILLLVSILFYVSFEILSKELFKNYKPMTVTFYSFFIGGALLFPLIIATHQFPNREMVMTPNFYIGIPFGILLPSVAAYSLWQWGLSKLPASRVGFFVYLDPVIAGIVAFFLFGEIVEIPVLIGGLFILSSLYFAESKHPYHHLIDILKHRETEYKRTK